MSDTCELRAANGQSQRHCEGEQCVYWRVAGHLGLAESPDGCAIQHFGMLSGGDELARWLLSVKDRVERPRADA